MNVNPRWSQPPDHPPGSQNPTEIEMGRLVNGFPDALRRTQPLVLGP